MNESGPFSEPKAFIVAFGSNVGDRERHIRDALQKISSLGTLLKVSGLYDTAAMYNQNQERFLNGVMLASTRLTPARVLSGLKSIEAELGRVERGRNGPREIDLDIVWFEDYVSDGESQPVLPHPRAFERRFVLEPLNELLPELLLQGYGVVGELLQKLPNDPQGVRRVSDAPILL